MKNQENLLNINSQIDQIINKALELESNYNNMIENVHPTHRKSALNLIHYLAFRSFDIDNLHQDRCRGRQCSVFCGRQ